MIRAKRIGRRFLEIVDYRTLVVATGFLLIAVVGYLVVSAGQRADRAVTLAQGVQEQQTAQRAAASRRVDLLQREIARLADRAVLAAEERGQLREVVDSLSAQVRQLGGTPVATAPPASSSPGLGFPTAEPDPTPTPSRSARPTASPTPRPSPTPTCTVAVLQRCVTTLTPSGQETPTRPSLLLLAFPTFVVAGAVLLVASLRRLKRAS